MLRDNLMNILSLVQDIHHMPGVLYEYEVHRSKNDNHSKSIIDDTCTIWLRAQPALSPPRATKSVIEIQKRCTS